METNLIEKPIEIEKLSETMYKVTFQVFKQDGTYLYDYMEFCGIETAARVYKQKGVKHV